MYLNLTTEAEKKLYFLLTIGLLIALHIAPSVLPPDDAESLPVWRVTSSLASYLTDAAGWPDRAPP